MGGINHPDETTIGQALYVLNTVLEDNIKKELAISSVCSLHNKIENAGGLSESDKHQLNSAIVFDSHV